MPSLYNALQSELKSKDIKAPLTFLKLRKLLLESTNSNIFALAVIDSVGAYLGGQNYTQALETLNLLDSVIYGGSTTQKTKRANQLRRTDRGKKEKARGVN